MKAIFKTNRIITTIILINLVAGITYGQGLLIEGAANLVKSITQKEEVSEFTFSQANYTMEIEKSTSKLTSIRNAMLNKDSNRDSNSAIVLKSFKVTNLDVSLENELNTETWMTESFSENIETNIVLEEWMTISLTENLETSIETEEWMQTSFTEDMEEALITETWMTEGLYNNLEAEVELEDWMTESFVSESLEKEIEIEEWMTTPFVEEVEAPLMAEAWMSIPLI
jgi:hypothetical protein